MRALRALRALANIALYCIILYNTHNNLSTLHKQATILESTAFNLGPLSIYYSEGNVVPY